MKDNVDTTQQLTHLAICAGYDGIGLGLDRVFGTCRPVAFVEIEAFAAVSLVEKMEAGALAPAPIWSDLKTFPAWQFHGCVDILSAGFPCQPFSSAGKGGADKDPRHLWPWVAQAIRLIRPGLVVLENVPGIVSATLKGPGWNDDEGTSVLLHVLRELERGGYEATWGIYSAEEVGAPHRRERVFIVAHADSQGRKGSQWLRSPRTQGLPQRYSCECNGKLWPSRPGEPQHDWEPPRTI